ncbi:hypothetical protein [Chitinophaga sp. 212800010-3]|uniref:hypothetical protein n=1 Tax=unclassified Chitinophaga TaxID=2619133 RepID=UPI002DE60E4E|nr:hypothetical protein [Chitinophaga sp. 212800010-3]
MEKELVFNKPNMSQPMFEKRTVTELSDDQMEMVDSGGSWTITLVATSLFCVSVYVGYKEAEANAK